MVPPSEMEKRFAQSMATLSGLLLFFLVARIVATGSTRFLFFIENLALAWLGFIFGWLLVKSLEKRRWLSWQNIGLTALWLAFLPNTWYVLSDFLHVDYTGEISELYDIAMTGALVVNGFVLGFASLYLVHKELAKRISMRWSMAIVGAIILLCSFAIYLGRELRWNSWDVVANPDGILINVSDRIVDPLSYPRAINITAIFFILISGIYLALLMFAPIKKQIKKS